MQYDFISIGDTVVDDFIRIKDAKVTCDINEENCTISMRFGDKVPFESSTVVYGVGNAANAAVSAARLGLKTAFVSNVGADDNGERIIKTLGAEGIDTSYISKDPKTPTNYHYVLWYETERTILVKQNAYAYTFPKDLPPPKTIYFSSINKDATEYRNDVIEYLEKNPSIFFAFQPGVFEIKSGAEAFARFYTRANFVICNKEEAARILGKTGTEEELVRGMQALGPKIAIVTDGVKGAYGGDGEKFFHVPMFPDPKPPLQRTGAGDALASTTAAYLTMGYSLEDSLKRGTVNSAYVVQGIGAQVGLLKKDELEAKLRA
jgi:2-dehydro-3-deoxygluconokinase